MSGDLSVVLIVLIVFGSILGVITVLVWGVVNLVSGGRRGRLRQDEESALIQELFQGLTGMEKRVESLETLLLERDK